MGRLIGKKPDETRHIAKSCRRFLEPDEQVLAGIYLQQPGTVSGMYSMDIGIGGSGSTPSMAGDSDNPKRRKWLKESKAVGIDEAMEKRATYFSLLLTPSRLVMVRRSRILRWRHRELITAWPLEEIERITAPRNRNSMKMSLYIRDVGELTFELPNESRFMPQVYRDLPALHEQALTKAGA